MSIQCGQSFHGAQVIYIDAHAYGLSHPECPGNADLLILRRKAPRELKMGELVDVNIEIIEPDSDGNPCLLAWMKST